VHSYFYLTQQIRQLFGKRVTPEATGGIDPVSGQLVGVDNWHRGKADPLDDSQEEHIHIPGYLARCTESLGNRFPRPLVGIVEMTDPRIPQTESPVAGSGFVVQREHTDPHQADGNVRLGETLDNRCLHRTGAAGTGGSGGRKKRHEA